MSRGAGTSTASQRRVYADQRNWSPWIAQFAEDPPPQPLDRAMAADVVVVGAGIAGIATAFFILHETDRSVMLLERDRVARGATGRNAGSLSAYFERPLCEIASEFGLEAAGAAQQFLEDGHVLLDLMVDESGADVRVERVIGHMGMFNRNHLEVHLRCLQVRKQTGLPPISIVVSEDAEFLDDLPADYAGLYSVVPQSIVRELLEVHDNRYRAVLSAPEGSANSGLLCQQVLAYLQQAHPGRFVYADRTNVDRVVVEEGQATVFAGGHRVAAGKVVLCTNGYVDHDIEDAAGAPIRLAPDQQIVGRVGYLTAILEDAPCQPAAISYIRNTVIGGDTPYAYVTRRTYDHAGGTATLTCLGGPEYPFDDPVYDAESPFPGPLLQIVDEVVRPFARAGRMAGQAYDFHWHGLMGYNESRIRVIGAHPRHERLLYNVGCNGVGFLASIGGGWRIAELLAGRHVGRSIFDPH